MKAATLARLDLNLLLVFQALYVERHVGRAATRLRLSQSATSHALSRLRDALADPLFIRNPKGVEPTSLANELAPRVAAVLEEIESIASPRRPFQAAHLARSFRIAATDHVIVTLMTQVVSQLCSEAPRVAIHFEPVDQTSVVGRLDSGIVDVALGSTTFMNLPQRVEAIPLFQERFVGVARLGHPLVRERERSHVMDIEDFVNARHALVSPRGDAHGVVDVELEKRGLARHIAVVSPSFVAIPLLIGGSDLVATVPRRAAELFAQTAGLVLFDLPIELPSWTVSLVRASARSVEPELSWLSDLIVSVARASC